MKRWRGVWKMFWSSGRCCGSLISQPTFLECMVYGSGFSPFLFIKEQDSPAKKEVQGAHHRPQQPTVDLRLLSPYMTLSKLPLRGVPIFSGNAASWAELPCKLETLLWSGLVSWVIKCLHEAQPQVWTSSTGVVRSLRCTRPWSALPHHTYPIHVWQLGSPTNRTTMLFQHRMP